MQDTNPAAPAPLAFTIPDALQRVPVSRTVLYSEIARGRLTATKVGRRTFITARALSDWLARCEAESTIDSRATAPAVAARRALAGR